MIGIRAPSPALPARRPTRDVVTAKAGTHNHRHSLLHDVVAGISKIERPQRMMGPCVRRDDGGMGWGR